MALVSETGMRFSSFIFLAAASEKELVESADLIRQVLWASSAANMKRMEIIICGE